MFSAKESLNTTPQCIECIGEFFTTENDSYGHIFAQDEMGDVVSQVGYMLTSVSGKAFDAAVDLLERSRKLGRSNEAGFRLLKFDKIRFIDYHVGREVLRFNKLENGRVTVRYPSHMPRQRLDKLVVHLEELC